MLYQLNLQEEKNRKKAMIISGILHLLVLLLALLPLMKYPVPPPGQAGVLVSFGEPDRGSGDDQPDTQQEVVEEQTQEVEEAEEKEEVEEVSNEKPVEQPEQAPEASQEKEVVTAEDLEAARIKKEKERQQAKEAAERKQADEQKRIEQERIAKEKARKEAEARKKAEEQKKYEEAKKQYGDLFGDGKGKTDAAGNQGDPNGDPNSDILEGVSTGTGTVGGGLGNRGVSSRPSITDSSQDRGVVVVKVCVDSRGNVTSAEYTQKGSYSISDNLRRKSIEAAKKFKFTPSSISKQCGTITFDYKLQ